MRTLSNGITSKAEGTLGFCFFLLHLTPHVMCEHIIFFSMYIYIFFFSPLSAGCKNSCQSTRRNPGPKV